MPEKLAIYVQDSAEFDSLYEWMSGLSGVQVNAVAHEALSGEQGSAWEFLLVSCGTGGAVTVALSALRVWIESRATIIRVKNGDSEIEIRSSNLNKAIPHLMETMKAIESDDI
jgi:hypothetical protein